MISANAKFNTNIVEDSHAESSNPCLFRILGTTTERKVSKLPKTPTIRTIMPRLTKTSNFRFSSIFNFIFISNKMTYRSSCYQEGNNRICFNMSTKFPVHYITEYVNLYIIANVLLNEIYMNRIIDLNFSCFEKLRKFMKT